MWLRRVWVAVAPAQTRLIFMPIQSVLNTKACRRIEVEKICTAMKVEYKPNSDDALFWEFECPDDVSFSGNEKLEDKLKESG